MDSHHTVEVEFGWFTHTISWTIDAEEVARVATSDDRKILVADGRALALRVQKARIGDTLRRVEVFAGETDAAAQLRATSGLGGTDLEPEPGSRAARRAQRMVAHPLRYTVERGLAAAGSIAASLLAIWMVAQLLGALPWPEVSLPKLPAVHLPTLIDLPDIDLPTIVDLPTTPAWVERVASLIGMAVPIVGALVGARLEIARRQRSRARAAGGGVDRPQPPRRRPYDQDDDSPSS